MTDRIFIRDLSPQTYASQARSPPSIWSIPESKSPPRKCKDAWRSSSAGTRAEQIVLRFHRSVHAIGAARAGGGWSQLYLAARRDTRHRRRIRVRQDDTGAHGHAAGGARFR